MEQKYIKYTIKQGDVIFQVTIDKNKTIFSVFHLTLYL